MGSSAVCTSSAMATTAPDGGVDVENIRHGEKGHQSSWPTTEPRTNTTASTVNVAARHRTPHAPSVVPPVCTR